MQQPIPLTRNLVLVGGGHAHALVLRMWGMDPLPGTSVTLISPNPTTAYSGMLPGFVAGHYPRDNLDIDLVKLARHAGARLILAHATGIDRGTRTVQVEGRPPVHYDLLSLDIGVSSGMPDLPGFAEHAVPAKPLDAFATRWDAFTHGPGAKAVVVIGAGVAGVELALAAAHRLGPSGKVTLVEAATALSLIGPAAHAALLARIRDLDVTLVENARVTHVTPDAVHLADGRHVASAFTVGAAAIRPQGWLTQTGLALTDGFVNVGPTLQSVSDPAVFATGDIAHMAFAPRPKAGVFAVRQAPILLQNLRALLTERGTLRRYTPQADYLKLISTGTRHAVADKWGLPLSGDWVWRWKDRIDRRFMSMFDPLPTMPAPPLPATLTTGVADMLADGKPLCGGCGAKVGGADLATALATLPAPKRTDVLSGPGDDAAILATGTTTRQVITTDHLRAFTADPWVMTRIAAIHALGDIWAMGAEPQAALAQIILPRMSDAMQAATLAEIMAAAASIFGPEGADIVGGHTSLGAELTIGFTVTGLAARPPLTLRGAKPGDALILTKPVGSGTIMAAEMLRAARGAHVAAALAYMTRSQGAAAAILAPMAHAMTDVTGFGLAGHLLGMLTASGTAAHIRLSDIPLYEGARDLAAVGHASSLYPQNRAACLGHTDANDSPVARLLFDPQTAGPLVAAVPAEAAPDLCDQLRVAGYTATIIGTVTAGKPFLHVTD